MIVKVNIGVRDSSRGRSRFEALSCLPKMSAVVKRDDHIQLSKNAFPSRLQPQSMQSPSVPIP